MPLSSPLSADEIHAHGERVGLNLIGLVAADDYDRCQPPGRRCRELMPGCGTAVVLASGGRARPHDAPAAHARGGTGLGFASSPLTAAALQCAANPSRHVTCDFAVWLQNHGLRCRAVTPEDRPPLNFVQLGETAGMGTVSPVLNLLIHPDYGPWIRFHGAVLVHGQPFGRRWARSVALSFQPCATCSRPCLDACPVGVYDGFGSADSGRCASHRHRGHCRQHCDVRRACPVGAGHRWDPAQEARHQHRTLETLRREHGLGFWRWVPKTFRR